MSERARGVKWEELYESGYVYQGDRFYESGYVYQGDRFRVGVDGNNWWVIACGEFMVDRYAPDFATAKRDAERWILEREGRLPAPATEDGGWIACSERMPENNYDIEVKTWGYYHAGEWVVYPHRVTHWRPRFVHTHAAAACLFDDRYRPTVEQARAAARHVAACETCRAKLQPKGGA